MTALGMGLLYGMTNIRVVQVVKNMPANAGDATDIGLIPELGRFSWRRKWKPTPVFLPGKSHEQRSLACYSSRLHGAVKSQT